MEWKLLHYFLEENKNPTMQHEPKSNIYTKYFLTYLCLSLHDLTLDHQRNALTDLLAQILETLYINSLKTFYIIYYL